MNLWCKSSLEVLPSPRSTNKAFYSWHGLFSLSNSAVAVVAWWSKFCGVVHMPSLLSWRVICKSEAFPHAALNLQLIRTFAISPGLFTFVTVLKPVVRVLDNRVCEHYSDFRRKPALRRYFHHKDTDYTSPRRYTSHVSLSAQRKSSYCSLRSSILLTSKSFSGLSLTVVHRQLTSLTLTTMIPRFSLVQKVPLDPGFCFFLRLAVIAHALFWVLWVVRRIKAEMEKDIGALEKVHYKMLNPQY